MSLPNNVHDAVRQLRDLSDEMTVTFAIQMLRLLCTRGVPHAASPQVVEPQYTIAAVVAMRGGA
jgi:hypothetical protein